MELASAHLAAPVASCCLKDCCRQLGKYVYSVQAEGKVRNMRSETTRLAAMRTDVETIMSGKQLGNSGLVKNWLKRSAAIEKAAEKVGDDYDTICLRPVNFWSRYFISKRASRKLKKIMALILECDNLDTMKATTSKGIGIHERQIETMVVGMNVYLQKALRHIDNDAVGVIGICGMGGVGKTTLLRQIHGEFLPGKKRSKEFDRVVWTVVFKKSGTLDVVHNNIARLQDDIARELGLHLDTKLPETKEGLEERARPIYEYLSTKSFLLLLDDLWSTLELKSIGIPDPNTRAKSHRQKVVLTSRSEAICGMMLAADGLINVQCLPDQEAWDLFEFNATKQTIESHRNIEKIAWKVMKECQGLPLAINTIGKALSTKYGDPRPWTGALAKLTKGLHVEIPGMEKENAAMLGRLSISYDYLPSQKVKDCFLSCCLWPEDYSIEKAKLVECWLGLGFISDSSDINADMVGDGIITSLKEAHLLEPGEDEATEVKMHDTIRDMSLWISSDRGKAKNKWLVKAGIATTTTQRVVEQWQEASTGTERVSLMNNLLEELPSVLRPLPNLMALMLQRNTVLRVVPGTFLLSAPRLTYLDLSNTVIEEIPVEIGFLYGLRYLNLSESYITKLPFELSLLTQLKYLLVSSTNSLDTIPAGVISSLGQLEILDVFQSMFARWLPSNSAPTADNELSLSELEERDRPLKWLGITLNSVEALKNLARCSLVRTRRLCLKRMPTPVSIHVLPSTLTELLGSLDMLNSLQEFMASTWDLLQQVVIEGGSDRSNQAGYCLARLEKLDLINLFFLESIRFHRLSANDFFPCLRSLKIVQCFKLTNVNWALYLPQLLYLEIQFCPEMEMLIDGTDTGNSTKEISKEECTFPLLKTVIIYSLNNLTSLFRGTTVRFPSLEILEISQCTKLTKLDIQPKEKLKEIRGGDKWWDNLEWKEGGAEELLPYFRSQGAPRIA